MSGELSTSEQAALATARSFIDAIVWGEHHRVWELLSTTAREQVLASATRRGMDAVASERARQGTWSIEERDDFLSSLIRGLRVDLSGVDIGDIYVVDDVELLSDGGVRVVLESATLLPSSLTGGHGWAAGAIVLEALNGAWQVRRLVPRPPAGP